MIPILHGIYAARSSAFDPSQLFSGGEGGFWYDFRDSSTMYTDTAGTTPVSSFGDAIARIDDKSGNGLNATQATAANRLSYQNGYAQADGNDFLTIAASTAALKFLHSGNGFGIAAHILFGDGTNNPNTFYYVMSNSAFASASYGFSWVYDDRTSSSREGFCNSAVSAGVSGNYSYQIQQNNVFPQNSYITAIQNQTASTNIKVWVDGVDKATSTDTSPSSTANASDDMRLFDNTTDTGYFEGRVTNFIVIDRAFTSQELADIKTYFESFGL